MMFRIEMTGLLLASALAAGCASVEQKTAGLDAELDEITRLWPGLYGGEVDLPRSTEPGPTAIFHRIDSIRAPQFGERVYFYQLIRDEPGGQVMQQKVFAFDTDPLRDRNMMRAWVLAPDQFDPGFAATPTRWQRLLPEQLMDFPEACAFVWRQTKAGIAGTVSAQECRYDSRAFGGSVSADMTYEISADALIWGETLTGPDDAVLATSGGPLRAVRIGPVLDVRRSYYDVQGASVMEIRRDLYAKSPIEADGEIRDARTDWVVRWNIESVEAETGCSVAGVSTTVGIAYLLPRLTQPDSVSAELQGEWDAYIAALLTHELRHQQFAIDAARKIEALLPDLPERETCQVLSEEAERIAGNVIQSAQRRERQYDYTTRHGYAEGAEFPASRRPD